MAIESPAAGGLRERKKREARARMLETAFELFQSQGYEQTSLAQIAAQAGVAPRTVSNYFPLKVDLLVAYRAEMLGVVEAVLHRRRELPPIERIRAALQAVARENQAHPNGRLAQRLLGRHGSYAALQRIQERLQTDLKAVLAAERSLREGVDLDLAVLALTSAHLAVIQRWASEDGTSLVGPVGRLVELWARGIGA